MLFGLANAILVIDRNIAYSGQVRANVYEHERNFPEVKMLDERILHTERENSDAINSSLNHSPD